MLTDEEVEAAAEVIYCARYHGLAFGWKGADSTDRDAYRRTARRVLEAARAAAKAPHMPNEDRTMQALPPEQAPPNGDHFLGLIEVPTPDDTGYREWREVYRDTDGVLYVPRPEDDLPLSDAYGEDVTVVGYLPLPSKQTESASPPEPALSEDEKGLL